MEFCIHKHKIVYFIYQPYTSFQFISTTSTLATLLPLLLIIIILVHAYQFHARQSLFSTYDFDKAKNMLFTSPV